LPSPIRVPYFLAVGNQDVDDEESERIFKEQVSLPSNGLYYSFSVENALFIVLDSNLAGHKREISSLQLDWLTKELKISGRQHKFVFLNHPLYSDRLGLPEILGGSRKSRERLRNILKSGQVEAVFAGHLRTRRGDRRGRKGEGQVHLKGRGITVELSSNRFLRDNA
jgi:hypothetical protein